MAGFLAGLVIMSACRPGRRDLAAVIARLRQADRRLRARALG
jgi:hypothetical protein